VFQGEPIEIFMSVQLRQLWTLRRSMSGDSQGCGRAERHRRQPSQPRVCALATEDSGEPRVPPYPLCHVRPESLDVGHGTCPAEHRNQLVDAVAVAGIGDVRPREDRPVERRGLEPIVANVDRGAALEEQRGDFDMRPVSAPVERRFAALAAVAWFAVRWSLLA
jgi:hypothetical protein